MTRSRQLALVAFALALVGLVVARPGLVLPPVGRFLVVADPLGPADAIISLGGDWLAERAFGARDLYRAGRAPHVLVAREVRPSLADEVERLGIRVVWRHDISRQVLSAAGVPATAIEVLPPAENTLSEARIVARLARERGWTSVIVVTSRFHSRRACWTFRRVLRERARVYCYPTPYDWFDPERWWRDDRMTLMLVHEYLKFTANFLSYGWRLPPAP